MSRHRAPRPEDSHSAGCFEPVEERQPCFSPQELFHYPWGPDQGPLKQTLLDKVFHGTVADALGMKGESLCIPFFEKAHGMLSAFFSELEGDSAMRRRC